MKKSTPSDNRIAGGISQFSMNAVQEILHELSAARGQD